MGGGHSQNAGLGYHLVLGPLFRECPTLGLYLTYKNMHGFFVVLLLVALPCVIC
jgi:hypothetical protein